MPRSARAPRLARLALTSVAALALVGCSAGGAATGSSSASASGESSASASAAGGSSAASGGIATGVTVTDMSGAEVTLPEEVDSVIATDNRTFRTLDDWGVELSAAPKQIMYKGEGLSLIHI